MRSVVDAFFGRFDEVAARRARLIVSSSIETELCASLHEIAVSNFDACTKPYGGGDDVIVGGYGQLVKVLASGIEIRTLRAAHRVSQSEATVTVALSDNTEIHAAAAIVTVPLGVLKAGRIGFDPPLPDRMTSAIDQLGFGRFEKVFLQFVRRWWTTSEEPNGLYLLGEDVYRYWLDLAATGPAPTLVAHIAGPAADRLAAASEDRIADAVAALRRSLRVDVPDPIGAYATDWRHDLRTAGAYTRLVPGVPRWTINDLSEPHGRVVFAGEHTSPTRYGYVDGAYTSGLRAAEQAIALLAPMPT